MLLEKLIVALGIDAKDYSEGLDKAQGETKSFGDKLGSMLGGALKLGLAATAGGVVAAIGGIVKGVASNAEFERYRTQFGVLLGSTEAAQKRLEELADFGARTPFELPQVVQADKILQGFGLHSEEAAKKFGFSGTQIRTIAGDLAAGTGTSFEEMSLLLGKFSAGATGEAISRMAELGIASRADLAKMGLEFDKSGALLSPLPKAMNTVLTLMQQKYGGMMDAQSQTFEGMISNLQDWVSGTLRTLSAPIFEVVKDKLGVLLTFLAAPETQAALNSFASSLASGVGVAIDFIANTAIPALTNAWSSVWPTIQAAGEFIGTTVVPNLMLLGKWLGDNIPSAVNKLLGVWNSLQPALNDVVSFIDQHADAIFAGLVAMILTVVIPAFVSWAIAAGTAAIATIAALAPILIPLALIGAAVALLYEAWNTNFLGIRDTLISVWENYLQPAFSDVADWLSVAIPAAISTVSDFWTNTLKPALLTVWDFIQKNVIPIFVTLVQVHIAAMKVALQSLASFWTNTLKPAIVAVWTFLNTYVIPLFKAIVNVHIAAFGLALRTLSAVFNNVVLPALRSAWSYINTNVVPILTWLYDNVIEKGLKPALASVAFFILGTLNPMFMSIVATVNSHLRPALETAQSVIGKVGDAFHAIDSAISTTISWIQKVADALNNISVPDWLQGHSPPPMAHWFDFIGESAQSATRVIDQFGKMVSTTNGLVAPLADSLDRVSNQLVASNAIQPHRSNNGRSSQVESLIDGAFTQQNNTISITGNYAHQEERTIRDEFRMTAMLYGLKPI